MYRILQLTEREVNPRNGNQGGNSVTNFFNAILTSRNGPQKSFVKFQLLKKAFGSGSKTFFSRQFGGRFTDKLRRTV